MKVSTLEHTQVGKFLGMARNGEHELAETFLMMADRHENEAEIRDVCKRLAAWSSAHIEMLGPLVERYGEDTSPDPDRLRSSLFHGARVGGLGLVRDLQDLSALATHVRLTWTSLHQAGQRLKDNQLTAISEACGLEADRQIAWLCTQVKIVSAHALVVPGAKPAELKSALVKPPVAPGLPAAAWSPLTVGALTLVVGVLALLAGHQPWLLPSLGPTAYLQAESPAHPTSRFYNTLVGHLVGLLAGFGSVAVFNAWQAPAVLTNKELVPVRVVAAVVAMVLTMMAASVLNASHPPAAATTLLVALGSLTTLNDAIMLMTGVVIIATAGEVMRRVRLGEMRIDPKKQDVKRPAPMPWAQK